MKSLVSTPRASVYSAFRRWIKFNLVGVTGVGVQFAVLSMLVTAGLDYLVATVLAVEAAVLNNFMWHERWTWRDRSKGDWNATLGRLIWFNLTIGSISIGQNVVFMKFLVGHLGLHYLLGNLISIVGCSLLNFYVSDRIVFQQGSRLAPRTTESSIQ